MKRNIYKKIILSLFFIGAAMWFGSTIIRSSIGFDVFLDGNPTLGLKADYDETHIIQNIYLFSNTSFYTMVGFGMLIVCGILFVILERNGMKKKGWLIMSFILIALATPVEVVLAYCDVQLINAFNDNKMLTIDNAIIKDYFFSRIKILSVPSGLSILAVLSAFIYLIWRPLDKSKSES